MHADSRRVGLPRAGKPPALDGGSGVCVANTAIVRHRPVLLSKQFLPRLDARKVRVDCFDGGMLPGKLLPEQLDPRPPRGLPRPLADVARLILAPGAAQHTV